MLTLRLRFSFEMDSYNRDVHSGDETQVTIVMEYCGRGFADGTMYESRDKLRKSSGGIHRLTDVTGRIGSSCVLGLSKGSVAPQ